MEKKTKLITIDYDEYLDLLKTDRERTIISCERIIKSLEDYRKYYNPGKEFSKLLDILVNHLRIQIIKKGD